MDPINPWLDAAEVRRLAARLMAPVRDPAASVADAGFDAAFVGYAAVRSTDPAPAEAHEVIPPPAQPEPPPSAGESGSPSARGPFLDRIQRFRDWMERRFGATGLFILDRDGSVIFDESQHGRLHFLARSLAMASRRQGASGGNVHVKIGVGATLEVVPVDTAYGCLVLGAVVPEALAPDAVAEVMSAFSQVASPPAGT
jgi:hypothetical protein